MSQVTRVLVVDDSAFARKVLRDVLGTSAGLEVVGTAADGLEALEKVQQLRPDVVTLDLVMPNLDGLGFLRALSDLRQQTRVVVVSISGEESDLVLEALQLGAVDFVKKPTALATDRLYELSGALVGAVRAAALATARPVPPRPTAPVRLPPITSARTAEVLVIGTSTGGPHALTRLLASMPADFPIPVAIALHIPADYTEALARRLDQLCALEVVEAHDGVEVITGRVVVARGGIHLRLERDHGAVVGRLTRKPAESFYFPSVDVLFESAAQLYGAGTLGVVLTGMGDDGLAGSRAIVARGGRVLTEAESSCVVFGMPRTVREANLSTDEAPIEQMTAKIISVL